MKALDNCGITSMWLQQDHDLDGWEERTEAVDSLLISDVEYEVSLKAICHDSRHTCS